MCRAVVADRARRSSGLWCRRPSSDEPGEGDAYSRSHLSTLLDRQQAGTITEPERAELAALFQLYQEGLLRKAHALAEAMRRGLRDPLNP